MKQRELLQGQLNYAELPSYTKIRDEKHSKIAVTNRNYKLSSKWYTNSVLLTLMILFRHHFKKILGTHYEMQETSQHLNAIQTCIITHFALINTRLELLIRCYKNSQSFSVFKSKLNTERVRPRPIIATA